MTPKLLRIILITRFIFYILGITKYSHHVWDLKFLPVTQNVPCCNYPCRTRNLKSEQLKITIIWSSRKSAIWEDLSRHSSCLLLVTSAGVTQLGLYNRLSRRFSHMAGCRFLSTRTFLWGRFCFLTAQRLGSKREHLKKLKMETTNFLRPAPRNWYGATSAIFYWPSSYKRFQGE